MSTGGKANPLLVPGIGTIARKSPVMSKREVVPKVATEGTTQSSLLTGGAYSLVGKAHSTEISVDQAVKSRGYARRSYRLYHKKLLGLLVHLDVDDTSTSVKQLARDCYSKLSESFDDFDKATKLILAATDATQEQTEDAENLYEEAFEMMSEVEGRLCKYVTDLSTKRTVTQALYPQSIYDDHVETDPSEKPQYKFRGVPGPKPEERDESAGLFFRALTINYKPSDNVIKFSGIDPLQYTSFRSSFESSQRVMQEIGYSPFDQFLELKKCVSGEPLKLITNLPMLDSSFETALELLDKIYLNPQSHIKMVTDRLNQLPKMTNAVESIRAFYHELQSIVHALQSLGMCETDFAKTLFFNSLVPKLSTSCCREFFKLTQRKRNPGTAVGHDCTINDLLDLILFQLQIGQQMKETMNAQPEPRKDLSSRPPKDNRPFRSYKASNFPPKKNFNKTDGPSAKCSICERPGHYTKDCNLLKTLTPVELFKKVNERKLCKLCLFPGHATRDCKYAKLHLCKNCQQRHNTLLHLPPRPRTNPTPKKFATRTVKYAGGASTYGIAVPNVLVAYLSPQCSNEESTRAKRVVVLFDTGSTISLIRRDLVRELGMKVDSGARSGTVRGIGGTPLPIRLDETVQFTLSPVVRTPELKSSPKIMAFTCEEIDNDLGLEGISLDDYPHLQSLEMSIDFPVNERLRVDVLLGEPFASNLITGGPIRNPHCDVPHLIAWPTYLGYFLAGCYQKRNRIKRIRVDPEEVDQFLRTMRGQSQSRMIDRRQFPWDSNPLPVALPPLPPLPPPLPPPPPPFQQSHLPVVLPEKPWEGRRYPLSIPPPIPFYSPPVKRVCPLQHHPIVVQIE